MPEATQQRGGRQERITCETPLTLADDDKYHLEIVRMRASVSIHDQFVTMSERLTGKIEIIKNPMFMRGVFVKKNIKVGDLQIPMHAKRIDILPAGFVPPSKDWVYNLGLVHTSKDGREFNGFVIFSDKSIYEYVQETQANNANAKFEHYVEPSGSIRIPYITNTKAMKVGEEMMAKAGLPAKRARTS